MSDALGRWVRRAFGAGVVVLLVVLARRVEWDAVADVLRRANPLLLAAAVACNLASLALKGVRWALLLRPHGVRRYGLVLRATFSGASLNDLLIAQGGEGARALLVARASGVSSARVLATLALDRAFDAVAFLVFLVSCAWLSALPPQLARWRALATAALVVASVVMVAFGVRPRRAPASAAEARGYWGAFADALHHSGSLARSGGALLLSAAAWLLQIATYHLGAYAVGLPLPLAGSAAAVLAVGASFAVRATPGNVGVMQALYAMTARWFGVAESDAVAAAILIQALQIGPVMLVAALGVRRWRPPSRDL